MPQKRTIEKSRQAKRQGKSAGTQAGEFVREEMHKAKDEGARRGGRQGRSFQQAVAIGLSQARRAGVKVPPKGGGRKRAAGSRKGAGASTGRRTRRSGRKAA